MNESHFCKVSTLETAKLHNCISPCHAYAQITEWRIHSRVTDSIVRFLSHQDQMSLLLFHPLSLHVTIMRSSDKEKNNDFL